MVSLYKTGYGGCTRDEVENLSLRAILLKNLRQDSRLGGKPRLKVGHLAKQMFIATLDTMIHLFSPLKVLEVKFLILVSDFIKGCWGYAPLL